MNSEVLYFSHVNEAMPERSMCVMGSVIDSQKEIYRGRIDLDLPAHTSLSMDEAKELHRLLGMAISSNEHRIATKTREHCSHKIVL